METSLKNLANELENAIGLYNPELKIYALKKETKASQKIWEYLCKKCGKDINNIEEANKKIQRLNFKTKAIFSEEEIKQLEFQRYNKL